MPFMFENLLVYQKAVDFADHLFTIGASSSMMCGTPVCEC